MRSTRPAEFADAARRMARIFASFTVNNANTWKLHKTLTGLDRHTHTPLTLGLKQTNNHRQQHLLTCFKGSRDVYSNWNGHSFWTTRRLLGTLIVSYSISSSGSAGFGVVVGVDEPPNVGRNLAGSQLLASFSTTGALLFRLWCS